MPTDTEVSTEASFPNWIGFIFIFNLIVGTGALTLPSVFAKAGWLLSLIVIILLALISYMTVTFVVEAMACTNAIKRWQNLQALTCNQDLVECMNDDYDIDNDALANRQFSTGINVELERVPLNAHPCSDYYYQLSEKYEMGEMATLFFNDFGRILFYVCLSVYLYGDLSIYSAAVSKSLRDIVCDKMNNSDVTLSSQLLLLTNTKNYSNTVCWQHHYMSRLHVYRLFLIGFTLIFGPFAAFSIQKTKYLQLLTVLCRWLAFIFMIGIAVKLLISEGIKGHPLSVNFYEMPSLFGACVYSFMCHHSLPSLLAPMRDKLSIRSLLSYDYLIICAFYIILTMTGIFAFEHIMDLYTLNFIPSKPVEPGLISGILVVIEYFLAFFPIFTLSTSYPIIAITLRNNLQSLFLDMTRFDTYSVFKRRILFPLCTICPPFIITYFTESLTSLVAFTGSYAGTGIQYIIPIALIYCARKTCKELLGNGVINNFHSPFHSNWWLILILIWSSVCVCLVTINFMV